MGWSMNGILAGALGGLGKGMSDWAGREIADEKKIAEEARLVERQKEMARYQDEIAGNRDVSRAELAQKMADKSEVSKRESMATNMTEVNSHNAELGLKKGSKEWMQEGAKFLLESGRPDEAKIFLEQYKSERDYDARLAEVAARRADRNAQSADAESNRAATLELRKEEREAANQKEHYAQVAALGTYKFKNKATGDDDVDYGGVAPLRTFDAALGKMGRSREDRLTAIAKVRSDADNYHAKLAETKGAKPLTREQVMRMAVDQYYIDNKLLDDKK